MSVQYIRMTVNNKIFPLELKVAIWSCVKVLEGNILLSCWSDILWMKITCTSSRFMEQSPLCYFNIFYTKFFFIYHASHKQSLIFIYNFQHCYAHYSRNKITLVTSFILRLVFFWVRTKIHKKWPKIHEKYVYLTVYKLFTRQKYFLLP